MSENDKNGKPIEVQNLGVDGNIHFSGVFRLPEKDGYSPVVNWIAHDNHVYIPYIKNGKTLVWEDAINEYPNAAEIKTQLFNQILGVYRKQSSKSDGLFSAALSVTDNNEVFIAYNTNEATPYHKSCAEANVLDVVMDMLTLNNAKTKELYLMAGPEPKKDATFGEHMVMPCGKCSDVIGARSTDDAIIVALPVNDGAAQLKVNYDAKSLSDVKEGEAWRFSVHNVLMRHSTVGLEESSSRQHQAASRNIAQSGWRSHIISRVAILYQEPKIISKN